MEDFLATLGAGLRQAAKSPNIHMYKTNSETHEEFHKTPSIGRILRGGNRSGKTVAGAVEGIWRATGRHPFQKVHEVPTRGRIVTVDRDAGMKQIILPVLKQWVPVSDLRGGSWEKAWSNADKVLNFANGSTIEIKTHQQEVDSFAGVPLHWIWFDEECPQSIFNECRLRLVDYNGVWYMTMTPVEGQDWIYDRFISNDAKNVAMFEVNTSDNPHLSKEALESLDDDLDDDEKKIRQQGLFVPKGGLVLSNYNYSRHAVDLYQPVPKSWPVAVSIDHGLNAPTAVLWHAMSPEGKIVTFKEHYQRQWVVKRHADRIKEINTELGITPFMYVCDPSMSQRNAETGLSIIQVYRREGIPVIPAKKDVDSRINKMNEYLEHDMWVISKECVNFHKEAKAYSFKIYTSAKIADRNNRREEPNKKNDHAMDSAGYYFMFVPFLSDAQKAKKNKAAQNGLSLTETNRKDFPWDVDKRFYQGPNNQTGDLLFGEVL